MIGTRVAFRGAFGPHEGTMLEQTVFIFFHQARPGVPANSRHGDGCMPVAISYSTRRKRTSRSVHRPVSRAPC
jgi:hypothetical protein